MRVGLNPHKDVAIDKHFFNHQIIIPVYLPNAEGYFSDALAILKICIESLLKTSHTKTFITIVNNGSDDEAIAYLDGLFAAGKIHELIHTGNCGKLNAIIKGLAGNNFPFITIADSDVLFDSRWQAATYKVFDAFPKAGAVCPTPSAKLFNYYTANIWFDLLFSRKMRFQKPLNPDALLAFAHSIDNPKLYNKVHLEKILMVSANNELAVVGAGHFVATYRGEVFKNMPGIYAAHKLGGASERKFLDEPVVKSGFWRLSTPDNHAWHMGNVLEDWMSKQLAEIKINLNSDEIPHVIEGTQASFLYWVKNVLFAKIIRRRKIMNLLLKSKGLSSQEIKQYI